MTEGNDAAWYSMTDLPATGALHVRVRGAGARGAWFEVAAARDVDKKGRHHWHEMRGRALVPLAFTPSAWQPLVAADKFWPAGAMPPEPLVARVVPRLISIGGVAFDAVAAAAEMEGDREAARANRDEPEIEDKVQWWRDVTRIKYEPMGEVSREHGEARIMRHLIVERSIPKDMQRSKTNAAVLADLKRSLADVYGEADDRDWVPRLTAQPEDWRDFAVVMGWFAEVMPYRREMIVMRARMQSPPISYADIGAEMRRSHEHVRRLYEDAVAALIEAGNRPPRRARARLAELRERNREARRT